MLEEQGQNLITAFLKRVGRFLGRQAVNIGKYTGHKVMHHYSETGKKSVKNLVRKGRDLELSAEINSKEKLKEICNQCRKQNIAFAIKKDGNNYRIVYQRKDSALVSDAIDKVIKRQLKTKPSLSEILRRNNIIRQQQQSIKTPVKHREVDAR